MPRSSRPRPLPCPRDAIIAVFLSRKATVLPVPLLVRAYVMARAKLRETVEDAWAALRALEKAKMLKLKPFAAYILGPREAALCPPADLEPLPGLPEQLAGWVFGEAALLLTLDDAHDLGRVTSPARRRAALVPQREDPEERATAQRLLDDASPELLDEFAALTSTRTARAA